MHQTPVADLNQISIDYAHDINVSALARLGKMLQDMPKHERGRPGKTGTQQEPALVAQTQRGDKMFRVMAHRHATQIEDLETLQVL